MAAAGAVNLALLQLNPDVMGCAAPFLTIAPGCRLHQFCLAVTGSAVAASCRSARSLLLPAGRPVHQGVHGSIQRCRDEDTAKEAGK